LRSAGAKSGIPPARGNALPPPAAPSTRSVPSWIVPAVACGARSRIADVGAVNR
jgi:hypothetical protein